MGPVAPIHIGTDAIAWVNKSRLLGTTVDDKLSWVPHMHVGCQEEFRKEARPNQEVQVFTKGCCYLLHIAISNLRPRSVLMCSIRWNDCTVGRQS